MTNISTATRAELRETLRAMRAENVDVSTQLDLIHSDIIGMDPVTLEHNGGNTDPDQVTTIRAGRLMMRCLAKNAARTAAKLRSASRAPARRIASVSRSYPKFAPGMSTAEYVKAFADFNNSANPAHVLPYDLSAYRNPCTLYEGNALDFEPIEQPADAPDLAAEALQPVSIVSELTGATMATVPRHVADQVSELIASATTAAVIEQASEAAPIATPDECEAGRELATVDACSESEATATSCDASSAGNAPSAPHVVYSQLKPGDAFRLYPQGTVYIKTRGGHRPGRGGPLDRAYEGRTVYRWYGDERDQAPAVSTPAPAVHTAPAPAAPTFQTIIGKSGNWCARFRRLPDGDHVLEFSTRPNDWSIYVYKTGRERMAALQAMARQAEQAAQTSNDDETDRERRLNAFDAMTATAADVQAMGAEYVAQLLDDLEDINYHTEGLILQALAAGREDLAARARANLREHLAAGYLTDALREDRQAIGEALRQSTKQRAYKGLFALVTKHQARELWNSGEPIGLLTYKRNTPFECDTMNAEYKAFASFDEKVTDAESQLRSGERIYFYAPAEHTGYTPPAPDVHQQTAPVPNLADKVPRAVGADSGPASNPPGATAPSAPAPSAPAPSAPAPDTEASADEPEPEFTRTAPQAFDMLAMIAAGLAPDDFVGLGIVYSGDRANPSGRGAITDVQPCSWYKYTITVTLEDGRQSRLNPVSFTEHLGNRYRTDFKRHGAPYLAELAAARLAVEAADKAAKQAAADDKARQRRELPQQWPQLKAYDPAGKLNGPTLAAHNIRVLLKEQFPKIKFSVKSDRYSGGDAIDIRWTDGPNTKAVEKIADQFKAGSFNGQEDIYEYAHSVFRDLFGDAKYIHCHRDISDALLSQAIAAEYPGTESRPTVEDYRKAQGVFSYQHRDEWHARRIRERLETMGAGLPS